MEKTAELIKKLGINPDFCIKEKVVIGKNLISSLRNIAKECFFIIDKTPSKTFFDYAGKEIFNQDSYVFCDYETNGEDLKRIIERISKNKGINTIVGVGAGRILDFSKFIAMKTDKSLITIPTALTTHVYASPKIHANAQIKSFGYDKTIDWRMPDLAIIEVPFLENMQKKDSRLIKTGLGDIMAFMIAMEEWKISYEKGRIKDFDEDAVRTIEKILKDMHKINVDAPLSEWILSYVEMQVDLCEITGKIGSAPASGSEHLFAKAAEYIANENKKYPLHGELVALGTLIMSFIHGKDYKKFTDLMEKLKLPNSLKEIGLTKEQAVEALYNSKYDGIKKGRYTILDELNMSKYYCKNIINNLLKEGIIQE